MQLGSSENRFPGWSQRKIERDTHRRLIPIGCYHCAMTWSHSRVKMKQFLLQRFLQVLLRSEVPRIQLFPILLSPAAKQHPDIISAGL